RGGSRRGFRVAHQAGRHRPPSSAGAHRLAGPEQTWRAASTCRCASRLRALSALAVVALGRSLRVPECREVLGPGVVVAWAAWGALGRPPRRLGGCPPARIRLPHRALLARGPGHRSAPGGRDQPGEPRLSDALRGAHGDRLEAVWGPVRALRHTQPADPAQRPGRAVAAELDATLRARRLPDLLGTRSPR